MFKRNLLFTPFILLLIAALVTFVWWSSVTGPVNSKDSTPRPFLITKGESLQSIARKLEKEGFVKDDLGFRIFVQIQGLQKGIKAGNYRLSPNLSLSQILSQLIIGPKELWITYKEGLRREEIVDATVNGLGMDEVIAKKFAQEFMFESTNLEGQLFPDTYLFSPDTTAKAVVSRLKAIFYSRVTEKMKTDTKANDLTFAQTLVLASIIERETRGGDERPIVAGILFNRLNAGWPLQTDATLQYITGSKRCSAKAGAFNFDCEWWKPPLIADKSLVSPFNTYTNEGLPPLPIANPGISAINAAIYPKETEYWFYLHGTDGQIHYGRTSEEHSENIRKYL